jgi:hypothetical protein
MKRVSSSGGEARAVSTWHYGLIARWMICLAIGARVDFHRIGEAALRTKAI